MRKLTLPLLVVLACSALLVAQDADSLLGRLQKETRALAGKAEGTVVTVRVPGAGGFVAGDRVLYVNDGSGTVYAVDPLGGKRVATWHESVTPGTVRTEAALVGTPPRVVVAHAAVGKATKVQVALGDGREVEAKLLASDAVLGVSVFALPDDVEGVRGLEAEPDWNELRGGTIAAVAGGTGNGLSGLALLRTADARLGRLDASEETGGAALVGVKGTLLGLRSTARPADTTSCQACHAAGGQSVDLTLNNGDARQLARVAALNSLFTASTTTAGRDPSPHFVPGPVIRRVLDDIAAHGRIRHGYLGVVLGDAGGEGARFTAVLADSPAQAAGLKTGQRVVRVDGAACASSALVSRALALKRPGDKVVLGVATGKDEITDVEVTLGDRAEAQKDLLSADAIGLECVEPGRDLRTYLGLDDDEGGVVVLDVRPGSAAARAGLRRGDLVQYGGGGPISNMEELHAALAGASGGTIELKVLRSGHTLSVAVACKQSDVRKPQ